MSTTGTPFVDRLEEELLGAICRRRRRRTAVKRLVTMTAVAIASAGALLLTGRGSSPALAVDVTRPLSEGSEVVFTVSSPVPSYWRLTALADFDGMTWSAGNQYHDARGRLELGFGPEVEGEIVTQTFEIKSLGSAWLPAAFSPVRVHGPDQIGFDAESSSLVTSSRTSDGLTYTVESVLPNYDVARLRAAGAPPVGGDFARYLALPDDFPAALADLARAITADASTPYDQAFALQNWFRTFAYEFPLRYGQGKPTMEEFLSQRRGYCEQFAGTYAAFARVLGLPSRVAIGFTPGERRDDGRYYVQGKHAHAWPEIYFEGVGWVPFEPTPGRGVAGAEQYTGVAADQADG
jgi:transglutaminase-like putative cysteine protease